MNHQRSMPKTISVEEAEDHVWGNPVAIQDVSKHRWYTRQLVVFRNDDYDGLWGFYYRDPLSELQEGQDTFEGDPVPIHRVKAREVTTVLYEVTDED